MAIRPGLEAPDFEARALLNDDFEFAKLSDYRGKWVVLLFYPGDFTYVCPTEVSALAAKHAQFQGLGVEVLSMSTDSVFTHKMRVDQELSKMVDGGVPFSMLSDEGGKIGTAYGIYDEGEGVDLRATFLIDPDGVIKSVEVLPPEVGRNIAELLRQVTAFQYVLDTGEVTPCAWEPTKLAFKPGPGLVGKVWQRWKPDTAF